jgi:hypothetical protein
MKIIKDNLDNDILNVSENINETKTARNINWYFSNDEKCYYWRFSLKLISSTDKYVKRF